jgi:hypothetical protein
MEREKIICIFCGAIAHVKEQDNLIIVSCPQCKRETEVDEYQEIFNQWLGDIRNKNGER